MSRRYYLRINIQKYGGLEITARGRRVLTGDEAFLLKATGVTRASKSLAQKRASEPMRDAAESRLLSELKRLRLDLARERRVAAYIIFPDSTLIEMAHQKPRTLDQMSVINGVGPQKLKEFGVAFLKVTNAP